MIATKVVARIIEMKKAAWGQAAFFIFSKHIALAFLANVDVLVSWNFKHIVHYDKIRLFNAVNIENGLKTIDIYSPREVTNYEE
jgi:hypothetical protein